MGEVEENKKQLSFSSSRTTFWSLENDFDEEKPISAIDDFSKTTQRKPGGFKSMPFILGNETFERLASIGLGANFNVFLLTQFHLDQVHASNVVNNWSGLTSVAPLLGAFIADAYLGRFHTIAFSSFLALLGMISLTLTAWIPQLRPPQCTAQQSRLNQCKGPTSFQMGILIMGLGLVSVGAGGIRPCSLPFGLDQFDPTTDDGRRGINSFFNWYYATFSLVLVIALTAVVYIQDSVSWTIGFGLPAGLMAAAIVLFFVGTKMYVYVKPEGCVFSGVVQGLVVAYKKRKLKLPADGVCDGAYYYDPPLKGTSILTKLPLTNRFRFLNKAAIIMDGEVKADGSKMNPWRLCSIQQIEEIKCLMKIIPVLASGVICFLAMAQQGTFTVSQALKMDRHLGPNFQVPAGSVSVISIVTTALWIPFYDRVFVPWLQKITKHEGGITPLQRIGIGIFLSILSMIVAGFFEKMRRDSATAHASPDGIAPVSVFWLGPQLILMGFAEAFDIIGQMELYYKEFPETMRSLAIALSFVTLAGSNYLSTLVVNVVHNTTGRNGKPDWLTKDINAGKVDYFYYLIAAMGAINLVYFLVIARGYNYKNGKIIGEENSESGAELELDDVGK